MEELFFADPDFLTYKNGVIDKAFPIVRTLLKCFSHKDIIVFNIVVISVSVV